MALSFQEVQNFIQRSRDLAAEARKNGQLMFETLLQNVLDDTRIQKLYWTQGTPSFNDGDPCTFSVHEVIFTLDSEYQKNFYRAMPEEIWQAFDLLVKQRLETLDVALDEDDSNDDKEDDDYDDENSSGFVRTYWTAQRFIDKSDYYNQPVSSEVWCSKTRKLRPKTDAELDLDTRIMAAKNVFYPWFLSQFKEDKIFENIDFLSSTIHSEFSKILDNLYGNAKVKVFRKNGKVKIENEDYDMY
jgi:hypothetical protein